MANPLSLPALHALRDLVAEQGQPCSLQALTHLARLARARSGAMARVVRERELQPVWQDAEAICSHLLAYSGWEALESPDRSLAMAPLPWVRLSEPQVTMGWAWFLSREHGLARCQAAFDAAWNTGFAPECSARAPRLVRVEIAAAEMARIDLIVIANDDKGQRHALCIEAKFGHLLTHRQLATYQQALARPPFNFAPEHLRLLVLAAGRRKDIHAALEQAPQWHFQTWQQWLIGFENALPPEADDSDFMRFRRTVLERAYEEKTS